MSTTATRDETGPGPQPAPAPPDSSVPPPRLHQQPWMLALAVIAALAGGAAGLIAWMTMSTSQQVVITTADIEEHQVIGPDDVRLASVSLDESVASIPGADLGLVVGQRAVSGISSGSVLAPDSVSAELFPPEGMSVVRVPLAQDAALGLTLAPGDAVRVVVSAATTSDDAEPTDTAAEVSAVHLGTTGAVLEVLVPHAEALGLTDAAARGKAAVILDGGARP